MVPLLIIGSNLYDLNSFLKEAKEYGVNRAIPCSHLKKLRWNQKILLAFYNKKEMTADVFAYFVLTSITTNAPLKLLEKAGAKVVRTINARVYRRCGSYTITAACVTDDSPGEFARKLRKLAKEEGIKLKCFVSAPPDRVFVLNNRLRVPTPFTRSMTWITYDQRLNGTPLARSSFEECVRILKMDNYKQRFTAPKERVATLEDWI